MRTIAFLVIVLSCLLAADGKVGPLSEKAFGERFLQRMLEQPGITKSESGIGYQRFQIGPGKVKPTADSDNITVD